MERSCVDLFIPPHSRYGLFWACQEMVSFEILLKLHTFQVVGLEFLEFCWIKLLRLGLLNPSLPQSLSRGSLSLTPVGTRQNRTQALLLREPGISVARITGWGYFTSQTFCMRKSRFYAGFITLQRGRQSSTRWPSRLTTASISLFACAELFMPLHSGLLIVSRCTHSYVFYKNKSRAKKCAL